MFIESSKVCCGNIVAGSLCCGVLPGNISGKERFGAYEPGIWNNEDKFGWKSAVAAGMFEGGPVNPGGGGTAELFELSIVVRC